MPICCIPCPGGYTTLLYPHLHIFPTSLPNFCWPTKPVHTRQLPTTPVRSSGCQMSESIMPRQAPPRLPITPAILQALWNQWSAPPTSYDDRLLWAASCLAFFGFFRTGEFTFPAQNSASDGIIALGDITRADDYPPSFIRVHLRKSKTDPYGKGIHELGRLPEPESPTTPLRCWVGGNHQHTHCMSEPPTQASPPAYSPLTPQVIHSQAYWTVSPPSKLHHVQRLNYLCLLLVWLLLLFVVVSFNFVCFLFYCSLSLVLLPMFIQLP